MITYFLNLMGPLNPKFIENYGTGWSMGRIDIMDIPDEPFGREYPIGPIRTEDWKKLGEWLWDLETENILTLDEILERYRTETGNSVTELIRDKE